MTKAKRLQLAAQREVKHLNIGPHLVLSIHPDGTAGGRKLLGNSMEFVRERAQEELVRSTEKVAFITKWLELPQREFEPYI